MEDFSTDVTLSLLSISTISWVTKLKAQYAVDLILQDTLQKWHRVNLDPHKYSLKDDLIFYKNNIFIGDCPTLKTQTLHYVHSDPATGHSGYERTLHRAKRDFYWKGMCKDLKQSNIILDFIEVLPPFPTPPCHFGCGGLPI